MNVINTVGVVGIALILCSIIAVQFYTRGVCVMRSVS